MLLAATAALIPSLPTVSRGASPTYRGAVVHGYYNRSKSTITVAEYAEQWVSAAAAQHAQIVVFAEGALGSNTALTNRVYCENLPSAGATLCDGHSDSSVALARSMSCLARKYAMVVVFAMCEVQTCHSSAHANCSKWADEAGLYHFNTQVAIGPSGALLGKYHKLHLYDPAPGVGESQHASYPPQPDPVVFDTDFGVRFGMHTCFDMAFRTPAAALALHDGVTDFVFPTGWVTRAPPMMPATEFQQGWSRGVGVNLLAADGGESWGSSGSGIYSRGTVLAQEYAPNAPPVVKLLVATLPKLDRPTPNVQPAADDWSYKTSGTLSVEAAETAAKADAAPSTTLALSTFVPASAGSVRASTDTRFSCALNYTRQSLPPAAEVYALAALDGSWLHGVVPSRSCLVYRCTSPDCSLDPLYSSPSDLRASTHFAAFSLSGSFKPGDLVSPMAATDGGGIVDGLELVYAGGTMRVPHFDAPLLNAMLYSAL